MPEILLQVIFLIILCGVISTLFTYSQEGDILTYTSSCPKLDVMKRKYPDAKAVMDRMHSLLIYKESYVKWNRFILIAMFASLVILYTMKKEIKISEFIILTCFLFLCIEIPTRWSYAHVSKSVIQEATQLYTYHNSL